MKLSDLLCGIDTEKTIGNMNVDIKNVVFDSKEVTDGSLFICLKGSRTDGHDFYKYAETYGAAAILSEKKLDTGLPQVIVKDSREAFSLISMNFYENVHKKLRIIGVVGTNGKTTTASLIKYILDSYGVKCGLIGTLGTFYGDEEAEATLTTPDPMMLNKIFSDMYKSGITTVVMEVSAHAIALKKINGISFEIGVFTNLSQDHLDYFTDMETYRKTKLSFFDGTHCKKVVSNSDNELGLSIIKANKGAVSYGINNPANVFAVNIYEHPRGTDFILNVFDKIYQIESGLQGEFNVYNMLAAASCCYVLGVPSQKIAESLNRCPGISGRLERFESEKCRIYIDYAHTPEALKNALITLKKTGVGKLICVFGCGGNRDQSKREIMGEISGEYADFTVITSDNPRYEEPMDIIYSIEKGVLKKTKNYVLVSDRESAIEYALNIAGKNDTVLIAGKGSEKYQEILGIKHVYNDKDTVKEILS